MLQIKTIVNRLDNAASFDEAVNAAIAEGWHLTKREVLQPQAQSETSTFHTMLYAELVKETISEDERNCCNCKHGDKRPSQEPCLSCSEDANKWEPADA